MESFKLDLEHVYLFVVAAFMLYLGLGNLWSHTSSHEFPTGYMASDTFQHQTRAQGIKDIGNYINEPPWIAAGIKDVIGFYPPGLYYNSIGLSYLSGLEVYDTIYIVSFLFSIVSALMFYFIVRKFNKGVAIISLPFSILIFSGLSMIGFTWGAMPTILAQVFLILSFWWLNYIDLKYAWLPLGLAFAGIIYTHSSELLFAAAFFGLYGLLLIGSHFILKKDNKTRITNLLLSGIPYVLLAGFFTFVAEKTLGHAYPFKFEVTQDHVGFPDFVRLETWGIFALLIIVGILIALFFLWKQKESLTIAFIVGIVMLLIGYGNYVGLNYRAFQARYFWPIYLSVFIGLAVYIALQLILKKVKLLQKRLDMSSLQSNACDAVLPLQTAKDFQKQ